MKGSLFNGDGGLVPSSLMDIGLPKSTVTNAFGSQATLARPTQIETCQVVNSFRQSETAEGTHVIHGMRVFKVGTFTDMYGTESTWESLHLEQMVIHFKYLKEGGYLPNIPVRADHGYSVKDVVGYFRDIYIDPDDPNFLAADVEITEPEAWDKWERGTWRSRSIEIGTYTTNNGSTLFPVVVGLAFVDLPAVEGLYAREKADNNHFFHALIDTKEKELTVTNDNSGELGEGAATAPTQPFSAAPALPAPAGADTPALPAPGAAASVAAGAAPAVTAPEVPAPAAPASFSIYGRQTTNFSEVQNHINVLEAFQNSVQELARVSFVENLAAENRIAATQIESLVAHCKTLTHEQFESFKSVYSAAPQVPILGNAGVGSEEDASESGIDTSAMDALEIDKGVVTTLRRAGVSEEKVRQTAEFKRLLDAGVEK